MEGDIASQLVAGVNRFLLREIELSVARRARYWDRGTSSATAYDKSIEANRVRFRRIIGAARDRRVAFDDLELIATTRQPALVAKSAKLEIYAVRWPVLKGIHGEGLLLRPTEGEPVADVVAIPDAGQTPEMLVGLTPGIAPESQFARRLAVNGCRVIVPTVIDRGTEFSTASRGTRRTNITHRELLYRPAFTLGRHIIGYEVHKVLAAVDWFATQAEDVARSGDRPQRPARSGDRPQQAERLQGVRGRIGVVGYGEGGLLAMYSGALDARVDATGVSGYFDSRQNVWQEPLDRNVFGLLYEFGDAEIAGMIAPRALVVEAAAFPDVTIPPGTGGGPGRLVTPPVDVVHKEMQRARGLVKGLEPQPAMELVVSGDGTGPFGTQAFLEKFLEQLAAAGSESAGRRSRQTLDQDEQARILANSATNVTFDPHERLRRQYDEINAYTQRMLVESPYVREQFMSKADRASRDPQKYQQSIEWYREYFRNEVVGKFDHELADPNPRSRKIIDTDTLTGYEVVLDVFPPDVFAYGILQIPKDIKPGQRRPLVVCQHGLEGRPQLVIGEQRYDAYRAFATQLAERGFVTFAPQNIYLFGDRFRTLQRKANAIKKTLYSIMVPQHEQIVRWLGTLNFVDADRIGFYGLSYGGVSAMKIPPLVDGYCLSICSANFNDWTWKVCSDRFVSGYYPSGEYEMFEFDLGCTFGHAEMAALICPRPFMVERGHLDRVGTDERVGSEYAKVRRLYADLQIPDRTEIEHFYGGHVINGRGTFDFLHEHLHWPMEAENGK
jgi:dienelactone hydrolase